MAKISNSGTKKLLYDSHESIHVVREMVEILDSRGTFITVSMSCQKRYETYQPSLSLVSRVSHISLVRGPKYFSSSRESGISCAAHCRCANFIFEGGFIGRRLFYWLDKRNKLTV